jgi:hypothetical protein
VWRQKAVEERECVDLGTLGDRLCQVGQADQEQQDERDRRQQCVEGQGTREKGDVVFVSRL